MNGQERDKFWKIVGYVFTAAGVVLMLELVIGLGVGIVCRIAELISAS